MTTDKAQDITSTSMTAALAEPRRRRYFQSGAEIVSMPTPGTPTRKSNDDRYDFVALGESIADSMVEAGERQLRTAQVERDATRVAADQLREQMVQTAEQRVAQAERALDEAKAYADELRVRIAAKNGELAEINDRLCSFGTALKEAHEKFHGRPDRRMDHIDVAAKDVLQAIEAAIVIDPLRQN